MAAMTQDRLTQIRQRGQKTGQYFGQDGALAQDELLSHAARDMGYLLDLLTNAQAWAAPRAPEGPPDPTLENFLEEYEVIGHWCPSGSRVRGYSSVLCSM